MGELVRLVRSLLLSVVATWLHGRVFGRGRGRGGSGLVEGSDSEGSGV